MPHPALTQLRALRYFAAIPELDAPLRGWLLLEDSMTKRFEQQGKKVTVTMINEGFVGRDALAGEEALLPEEARYWLREIILCADGEPWLAGRTRAGIDAMRPGISPAAVGADAAGSVSVYVVDVNP